MLMLEASLSSLIGKRITVFCCRYIYTGILIDVYHNSTILLRDAGIVFETGELDNDEWTDMQKLPHDWCVQVSSIESFGVLKSCLK